MKIFQASGIEMSYLFLLSADSPLWLCLEINAHVHTHTSAGEVRGVRGEASWTRREWNGGKDTVAAIQPQPYQPTFLNFFQNPVSTKTYPYVFISQ